MTILQSNPSARSAVPCLMLLFPLVGLEAQALTFTPAAARYHVTAEFQGQPMEPWDSRWTVRDTTIGGKKAVVITHLTIREAMGTEYESTALLDATSGRLIAMRDRNNGREPGATTLTAMLGRLKGTTSPEGAAPVPIDIAIPEAAIPDFAVAPVLAARKLTAGDTLHAQVFTYAGGEVRRYEMHALVQGGMFRRAGAIADEPVWIIQGDNGYPARFVIARSDRQLLQIVVPQGSVGSSTETYAGVLVAR